MKTSIHTLYKKMIGVCGLAAIAATAHAQFTFPVYEPFNYPEGERLRLAGSSATNWNVGNSYSSTGGPLVSATNALAYPGLSADPNSPAKGLLSAPGVGRTACATFNNQTNGTTVYASFMLDLLTLPSGNRAIFGLNPNNSGTPSANAGPAINVTPTGQLLLSKSSVTPLTNNPSAVLLTNTPYFIVMAYKFNTPSNEVDLWINPTSLGNDGAIPAPSLVLTNGANVTNLQTVCLYSPSTTPTMSFITDEIRVGTNWSVVTPIGCSPGTSYTVTGGGSGCPGTSFPVGLAGSQPGVNYLLYTNGSFANQSVAGTGSAISFGAQNVTATYSVLGSNTSSSCVGWMGGSVAITVLAGPAITSQPTPVTVANNGTAYFNVSASGLGLNYHWYKGGTLLTDGGHVSGSTTSSLSISPATSADAAVTASGYYVIITNSCGLSATSVTNALTIGSPANLIWAGGNPNTNWDLATTLNFLNGASPAVFNNGDNVTFDGSSAYPVVTLTSSQLVPGVVTFNSGNAVSIAGNGAISGNASVVNSGSGLITISNVNTYTGSTTLNPGSQMILRNSLYTGLGTGTLIFNGGLLDLPVSGSATAGLVNPVNVTDDSTLEYEGTGSFGGVILGSLSGTPGKTLTISHLANTSLDKLRIYSTNMTMNAMINASSSYTQLATYNSSGTQVYNGVISGSASYISRHAGTVIFNGANTYAGPALLTSGAIGIGVDSVPGTSGAFGPGLIILGQDGTSAPGSTANVNLFASGGDHVLANSIIYSNTITVYTVNIGGTNSLTLSGSIDLSGADATGNTNRVWDVTNTTAKTIISGVISDSGLNCGLTKTGNGALALTTTETYTGPTICGNGTLYIDGSIGAGAVTVTNGTLAGSGTIGGAVTVQSGAVLAPGDGAIGTLAISGALTLQSGSTVNVEVNKLAGTHDLVTAPSVAYSGTLNAVNLAGTPALGNTFQVFNASSHTGNFTSVTGSAGSGLGWSFNPANGTLTVVQTVNTNATNITYMVTYDVNNNPLLTLHWPTDHQGWRLQAQTNAPGVGITTNWFTVAGSTNVTSYGPVSANSANGSVFFRMVYP